MKRPGEDNVDRHAHKRDKKIDRRNRPTDNRRSVRLLEKLSSRPKTK
ncbi:MAG: hypothetical protein WC400_03585 [Patescibacteria group bacterium]|jgi:hypothetical protein